MKMSLRIPHRAMALLWALTLSFIITAPVAGQTEDVVAAFRLNQSKWAAQQIKNYQFVFRRICFCLQDYVRPVIITVRDGKIQAVRYADRDQLLVPPDQFNRYLTIDELFATIQQAIERQAHRITATYDPRRGFPTSISIDYVAGIADDEQGFRISTLKVGK